MRNPIGEKLPYGWYECHLNDVYDFLGGGTPDKKNTKYWDGGIYWATVKDIKGTHLERTRDKITSLGLAESASQIAEKGEVIIITRISPGESVISKQKIAINQDLKIVRNLSEIPSLFTHFLFKILKREIIERSSGTTVLGIRLNELNSIKIKLPPLPEQHRIVAKIEELFSGLDAGIRSLETARAQLKRYRQAVLKHAFEGKLTRQWRERNAATQEPAGELLKKIKAERERLYRSQLEAWEGLVKQWETTGKTGKKPAKPKKPKELPPLTQEELNDLLDLPDSWRWVRVGTVSNQVTVGHVGPMKNEYKDSGIPFLRSQNVRENRFDNNGLKYISNHFHCKLNKSKLTAGDVVIVRSGNVGTACVIPEDLGNANCFDLVIVKKSEYLNSHFLSYYMNSVSKSIVIQKQVGVALVHFNTKTVENFLVPICPLEEQDIVTSEIEARLSVCDMVEQVVEENLKKAESLRQSILKKAFEGKLVPQDPNDEPAHVLLERIKKEKDQLNKGKRKKSS